MRPLGPESELLLCCARTRPDDGTAERIRALVFQPLDWDWLLRTARPHGMLPLLHRHLSASPENIPAPVLAALSDGFQVSIRQSLRLVREMVRLLGRFAERRVVAVPYKGPTLAARCYGDLSLRPFRDLDFLVRPQDLAPARQVLAADGYTPSPPRTPRQEAAIHNTWREDAFWRDADVVELHWAFAPREFPLPLKVEEIRRSVGIRNQRDGKIHRQARLPVGRLVSEGLGRQRPRPDRAGGRSGDHGNLLLRARDRCARPRAPRRPPWWASPTAPVCSPRSERQ